MRECTLSTLFSPCGSFLRKIKVADTSQYRPESSVTLSTPLDHKDKGKGPRKFKGSSIIWERHTCEPYLPSQTLFCLSGTCSWSDRNLNQQSLFVTDEKAKDKSLSIRKILGEEVSEPTWYVHWRPSTQNTIWCHVVPTVCWPSGTAIKQVKRQSFPWLPVRWGRRAVSSGALRVCCWLGRWELHSPLCVILVNQNSEARTHHKGLLANGALYGNLETEIPVPTLANDVTGL